MPTNGHNKIDLPSLRELMEGVELPYDPTHGEEYVFAPNSVGSFAIARGVYVTGAAKGKAWRHEREELSEEAEESEV